MRLVDKQILQLAVPSIVSNITVPLLGLADLAIVGHMGSEQYIAAIAVGSMIFNVIYWLFGFLRMGTSGMTSQALGRGDSLSVRRLLRLSLKVSMVIAALFLIAHVPLCRLALVIISPSQQVWPLAVSYFNIVIWGAPAVLGLYGLTGWFIGVQNTRIPMLVAIGQNIINIVASLAFVFGLDMRIEGVALGTLVAQWSGFLMAWWWTGRQMREVLVVRSADSGAHGAQITWGAFFRVNRDIFLRTLCLVAVNLFFTSAGARQGDMMLAVNTLLMTFFTLFSYVMDGFAFAGEALAGRLYGACDIDGLRGMLGRLWMMGGAMVVIFTAAYVLAGDGLLSLLTDDRTVAQAAGPFFFWVCLVPVAGVGAFIYDGLFIGLTATRGMLFSGVVSAVLFFVLFFLGTSCWSPNHALWLAFVVYLGMRGVIQHWIIRKYLRL